MCRLAIFSAAADDISDATVQVCLVIPGLKRQRMKKRIANGELKVDFDTRYSKCTPYVARISSFFLFWDGIM